MASLVHDVPEGIERRRQAPSESATHESKRVLIDMCNSPLARCFVSISAIAKRAGPINVLGGALVRKE